jgi:outer membrane protein assembly factor BamB
MGKQYTGDLGRCDLPDLPRGRSRPVVAEAGQDGRHGQLDSPRRHRVDASRHHRRYRQAARGQQKFHATQNLASPSCTVDGEVVVAHFGNGDLAAYDFAGNRLWSRNLQEDFGKYTIWWGHANSPVLHGDAVISVCMQDSLVDLGQQPSPSYVVAHHKRTGQLLWHTPRPTAATSEPCDSYTTPVFHQPARASR